MLRGIRNLAGCAHERYRLEGARGLASVGLSFVGPTPSGVHPVGTRGAQPPRRHRRPGDAPEHVPHLTFDDAATLEIASPAGNGDSPDRLVTNAGSYHRESGFVIEIPDVTLLGPKAIPVTDEGVVLEAFSSRQDRLEEHLLSERADLWRLLRDRTGDPDQNLGTVCSFASVGSGYCEWVQSVFMCLQGLERYAAETGTMPTILLGPDPSPWVVDSLEFLGYENWTTWSGGTAHVKQAVVPSVRTGEYTGSHYAAKLGHDDPLRVVHPGACEWLRERALDRLDDDVLNGDSDDDDGDDDGKTGLDISRAGASKRRVRNRGEVETVLSGHGIVAQQLETLPFAAQVAVLAEADVVVAPHGAGLVSTVFAPDTTVVELFGANVKSTYFLLAGALGHDYRYLLCESAGDNLVIDTDALDTLLSDCPDTQ